MKNDTDQPDSVISGHRNIREAYRDKGVASAYINNRFVQPLGAELHVEQVSRMREVIHSVDPGRVLEIAPGPARLSADLARDLRGRDTLVDASAEMLAEARTRLKDNGVGSPALVQADAYSLPFGSVFDLAYSFRLIRHFAAEDRKRLYLEVARVLKPGGWLVFDAINEHVARPYRERDSTACFHYDALLTERQIADELTATGFSLTRLDPVQRRYSVLFGLQVYVAPRSAALARATMRLLRRIPGGQPMEWIVTCRRR
jgi:ubiquinone/menaquinone biosynthesis C-methylase UbiE